MSEAPNTVTPFMKPDPGPMRQHLEMLFERAITGRIEICAIHTAGREGGFRPEAKTFPVDDIDAAINYAVEVNSRPQWNVYVGAAVRHNDTPPFGRSDESDVVALYALFADADTPEQLEHAKAAYSKLNIRPPVIVITGREPHTRAQMWWPLEDPITDTAQIKAHLTGLINVLGTDQQVKAASQVMRLAGGISWPKPNKPGRVLEQVTLKLQQTAQPMFHIEQIARACPPSTISTAVTLIDHAAVTVIEDGTGPLGMGTEKLADGREGFAFRLTRAVLHEFIGTNGAAPTATELYQTVAPLYFSRIVVTPERGTSFLAGKCQAAIRAFEAGHIPFCRNLDHGVMEYQARLASGKGAPSKDPFVYEAEDAPKPADEDLFEVLSISDIKALPPAVWTIKNAIPQNSFGFIYGAPGSFKTFVCYDLALALAYGHATWMGREVNHKGSVLYIASEGSSGFKNRITAWQIKHGCADDDGQFRLIRRTMNFMDKGDIDRLERTVDAVVATHGPVETIFVDTVSRVLPGADENMQKDMTVFVSACDRLRERFGASVIGVHHTGKDGETMRGSTVFLGQGDFIFKCEKEDGGKSGVLTCEKQKDGEDGWKNAFSVETQEWVSDGHIETVSSLTIEFTGEPSVVSDAPQWPTKSVCRDVLSEISKAWMKGKPWSQSHQSRASGRYAVERMAHLFGIKKQTAEMMLSEWQANDVLAVEKADSKLHITGLKVLKWLD